MLSPHWSPDGRKIVFGMGRFVRFTGAEKSNDPKHGDDQVGVVNADGSEFDVITSGPNSNVFPSFSPDGKLIVYRTNGPDGEGLRIMNIEDRSVTVLTNDYDNFPVWSPRGDLIEFTRKVGQYFEVFHDPAGWQECDPVDLYSRERHSRVLVAGRTTHRVYELKDGVQGRSPLYWGGAALR